MREYCFKAALRGARLLMYYVNANFDNQFYALTNCVATFTLQKNIIH